MSLKRWIKNTHQKNLSFSASSKNARWFSVIMILIIALVFTIRNSSEYLVPSILGAYFLVSLVLPKVGLPVLYLWMWVGSVMGQIISSIFLGVIYFFILLPISLLVKKADYAPQWKVKKVYSPHDKMH